MKITQKGLKVFLKKKKKVKEKLIYELCVFVRCGSPIRVGFLLPIALRYIMSDRLLFDLSM